MTSKKKEQRAIEYLREWAREGFPKRVDGSFPTDFLTSMSWLMDITREQVPDRDFEELLVAGPDMFLGDSERRYYWWKRGRELMGVQD
jgi:hypothetical protein